MLDLVYRGASVLCKIEDVDLPLGKDDPHTNWASCGLVPSCPNRRLFVKFTDVLGRRAFLPPSVKMGMIKVIKMDLHGYHPSEIVQTDVLKKIIQQTWGNG